MIEAGRFLQQRYRIDKQIGQGGMGAVYVATDERFGSTVAIKETLCMDDNFRKAIEREARLLNSLKHTALPRVSDHFLEDEGQFLVMEYIPGEDLMFILERDEKPFPVETVLTWADQLLDALDFLHGQENPVVHRDIKPQNLKVTTRGQIILLDFGLAKGNPTDAGHQTAAKSIFGYSRNYASLEQIQGTGTDPRSDLYSLAATLYHLMTGVVPEDALTRAMSVLSGQDDPLVPASSLRPEISRGVAGVLQKALALNAGARPDTAAEMRQMFREPENYAYLADAATVAEIPADAQVYAQATKLMPDETQAGEVKQTDIKTEVLPAFSSEMTSVRGLVSTDVSGGPTATQAPRARSRFSMALGALIGLVLVGCGVAGGLYALKPSVFGVAQPASNSSTEQASQQPVLSNANTEAAPLGSASNVAVVTPGEKPKTSETAARPTESAKSGKSNQTSTESTQTEEPQVATPPRPGEIIVTETLPNGATSTRAQRPGQPFPKRPIDPNNPFPNGFDPYRNMTPAQRKRLREVMRNGGVPPANRPN
jgi:eukaryotic-like serine/threonine-protein kinase